MRKKVNLIILFIFLCMPFVNSIDIKCGNSYLYNYTDGNSTKSETFYCKQQTENNNIATSNSCGSLSCGNAELNCPEIPLCPSCPELTCEDKPDYTNILLNLVLLTIMILYIIFKSIKRKPLNLNNPKQNNKNKSLQEQMDDIHNNKGDIYY